MDELQLTRNLIDRAVEKFLKKNTSWGRKIGPATFESLSFSDGEALVADITAFLKTKGIKPYKKAIHVIGLTSLKAYYDGGKTLSPRAKENLSIYLEIDWKKFEEEETKKFLQAIPAGVPESLAPASSAVQEPPENNGDQKSEDEKVADRTMGNASDEPENKIKRSPVWQQVAVFAGVIALAVSAFYIREISSFMKEILSTLKEGPSREPAIVDMSDEKSFLVDDRKLLENQEQSNEDKDIIRLQPAEKSEIVPEVGPIASTEKLNTGKDPAPLPKTKSKTTASKKESISYPHYDRAENVEIAVYPVKDGKFNNSLAGLIRTWAREQNMKASTSALKPDFYHEHYFERAFNGDTSFLSEGNIADNVSYLFLLKSDMQFSASKVQSDLTIGKAKYEIVVVDCRTGSVIDSYNFTHTKPGISEESIDEELQNLFLQEIKNHPLPIK